MIWFQSYLMIAAFFMIVCAFNLPQPPRTEEAAYVRHLWDTKRPYAVALVVVICLIWPVGLIMAVAEEVKSWMKG